MPGQKLSEAALSESLDISRNTLREVFRTLTKEGLIKHAPNRGVFVATPIWIFIWRWSQWPIANASTASFPISWLSCDWPSAHSTTQSSCMRPMRE